MPAQASAMMYSAPLAGLAGAAVSVMLMTGVCSRASMIANVALALRY